jgi:hypothetical protein
VLALALLPGTASALNLPAACSGTTGNPASLVNAITFANASPGPDTVELGQNCTYTLTNPPNNHWYGPNGLPEIASDVTIEGNGATIARSSSASGLRFFFVGADPASASTPNYVTPGAGRLRLRDLMLRGGLARGGGANGGGGGAGMGGAIFSQGTVILERTTLTGNVAEGGSAAIGDNGGLGGGGIGQNSFPTGERHGGGFGDGSATYPSAGVGGAGGSGKGGGGGAGFRQATNGDGSPGTVDGMGNRIGGDGGGPKTGLGSARGGSANGAGGFGGDGSGAGGGGESVAGGTGGPGGGFGLGGREGSSLLGYGGGGGVGGGGGGGNDQNADNGAGGGGGGFGGGGGAVGSAFGLDGSGGDGGFGGGGAGACGTCVTGNPGFGGGAGTTDDGSHGPDARDFGGGGAGMGGAVFNMQGRLTIRNSTFSGNSAVGGAGGASNPGQGLGGAVFNLSSSVAVDGSTFAANTAAQGGDSIYNLVYDSVDERAAEATLRDTIIADGGPAADLVSDMPILTNANFNDGTAVADVAAFDLVRTMEARLGGTITGSPLTSDPQLGALANNGGPTPTMALPLSSPAVDKGIAGGLTTDQRGLTRPVDFPAIPNAPGGDGTDIGAFEVQAPGEPPQPSNQFSFGKVKKNKRKGTAKLTVEIEDGPGELGLTKTKKVKADDEAVEGAGRTEEKLAIKPKGKARKKLGKKGKAKVKAEVTYTPDGGEPNTQSKKLKLKKRR